MIVDDHKALRVSLRDWLNAEFPQCLIIEAASGEEAVALTQTISPNIIIMDIRLPGIDGIEATRRITISVPAVKVVILTIHEEEIYRANAMDAGASAYISKRRMRTELLPKIAALLSAQKKLKKKYAL